MSNRAYGIDLGTTNSVLATRDTNGQTEIVRVGANDEIVLRSAVYFSNIGGKMRVSVGREAINRGLTSGHVENFRMDFKRDIAKNVVTKTPDNRQVNSVILSAMVLNEFKKRIVKLQEEQGLAYTAPRVVITVPAYFTSKQRAATKNAGRLAGFEVLRIINEPTAAAIAYAHDRGVKGNILVYDLGGGTFDVTVLQVDGEHYDIKATDGNHRLGGLDFDKQLAKLLIRRLEDQGVNMTKLTEQQETQLLYEAEKLKIALSVNDVTYFEYMTETGEYGVEITQDDFQREIRPLLKDTEIKLDTTLRSSGLTWKDIDHILLVGGSTRMPVVRQMIEALSGKRPEYDLNPDIIVAEGAAIIADLMANHGVTFSETHDGDDLDAKTDGLVIRDVTSQGLGILLKKSNAQSYPFVGDYYNRIIVPRNTVIPATFIKDDLVATVDGQTNFGLRLTEGNYENPMDVDIILNRVEPVTTPRRAGEKLISIRLDFDEEQIVYITITDSLTGKIINQLTVNTTLSRYVDDDLTELQAIFDAYTS